MLLPLRKNISCLCVIKKFQSLFFFQCFIIIICGAKTLMGCNFFTWIILRNVLPAPWKFEKYSKRNFCFAHYCTVYFIWVRKYNYGLISVCIVFEYAICMIYYPRPQKNKKIHKPVTKKSEKLKHIRLVTTFLWDIESPASWDSTSSTKNFIGQIFSEICSKIQRKPIQFTY